MRLFLELILESRQDKTLQIISHGRVFCKPRCLGNRVLVASFPRRPAGFAMYEQTTQIQKLRFPDIDSASLVELARQTYNAKCLYWTLLPD
jgi:hypothetical protein